MDSFSSEGGAHSPARRPTQNTGGGGELFYVDAEGVRVRLPGLEKEYLGLGGGSGASKYSFTIKQAVAPAADTATLRSAFAAMPPPPPGKGRPRLISGRVSPRQ
eukprot:scaffold33272_cov84-Isochrysis_galbana.AAC.1